MNFNGIKAFAENFSAFLTKFHRHQQQKIDLPTSVHLSSERESHAKETRESNLSNNDLTSPEEELHDLRLQKSGGLVCAHLNINSLRNKFNLLANIVKDKINILMISETKLDSSFPKGQFIYMASLNHIDLTEMEMVVEYLCLFVRTYRIKNEN